MTHTATVIHGGHRCFRVDWLAFTGPVHDVDDTLVEWLDHTEGESPDLIVKTGAQFGPYAVTVSILTTTPEMDDIWEDVSEVSVEAQGQVGAGELVDGPQEWLPIADGPYRVRVSARGRSESAERENTFPDDDVDLDDDLPLEHYLVEPWSAPPSAPVVVRESSRYAREERNPPPPHLPPERELGLTAARSVAVDLRGGPTARPLSGRLCDVRLSMEAPGTPTQMFNRVRHANGWPPGNGGRLSPNESVGDQAFYYGDAPDAEAGRPLLGTIETEVVEHVKPKRFAIRWNWRVAGPGGEPYPDNPLLLDTRSTVRMTFAQINGAGQEPRTLITVTHSGVPQEWSEDLVHLWTWDIAVRAAL